MPGVPASGKEDTTRIIPHGCKPAILVLVPQALRAARRFGVEPGIACHRSRDR